jgi:hypothetical protein
MVSIFGFATFRVGHGGFDLKFADFLEIVLLGERKPKKELALRPFGGGDVDLVAEGKCSLIRGSCLRLRTRLRK